MAAPGKSNPNVLGHKSFPDMATVPVRFAASDSRLHPVVKVKYTARMVYFSMICTRR